MSTSDSHPSLVVIAPPRKTRYSRKMAQPVESEEEAAEAVAELQELEDDSLQVAASG